MAVMIKGMEMPEEWVDRQPTVDAVPVVPCKYCQNYEMARNEANGFCYELDVPMAPWEFCSRGEKKDAENHDD